jgi:hypothetical protein
LVLTEKGHEHKNIFNDDFEKIAALNGEKLLKKRFKKGNSKNSLLFYCPEQKFIQEKMKIMRKVIKNITLDKKLLIDRKCNPAMNISDNDIKIIDDLLENGISSKFHLTSSGRIACGSPANHLNTSKKQGKQGRVF